MDTMKSGTVTENNGKTFPNRFKPGSYQQMLTCTMQDGTQEKIFFDAGKQPHTSLGVGSPISIIYTTGFDGKQIRRLMAGNGGGSPQVPVSPLPHQQAAPWDDAPLLNQAVPAEPQTVDNKILDNVEAMVFIYNKLAKMMDMVMGGVDAETLRSFTATIFIQMAKQGHLAISQETVKEMLDAAKQEAEMETLN